MVGKALVNKVSVNWQRAIEQQLRLAQSTDRQALVHLLERHGLVDSLTMGVALDDIVSQATSVLDEAGAPQLSGLLGAILAGAYYPGSAGLFRTLPVPANVTQAVLSHHADEDFGGRKPVRLVWDGHPSPHEMLKCLDLQRGLSPYLWVLPRKITVSPRVQAFCARHQRVHVDYYFQFEKLTRTRSLPRLPPDVGRLLGVGLNGNLWWASEACTAAAYLAELSPEELRDLTGKQSEETWVRAGGRGTWRFWDTRWRERRVTVWSPAARPVETNRKVGKAVIAPLRLPEPIAMPFYRREQLRELHQGFVDSHIGFSLLGTISDTDVKNGRLIAQWRRWLECPRMETRGRPKRDPELAEKAFRLLREGRSKRRAAKELGVPRSTFYDRLNAEQEENGLEE